MESLFDKYSKTYYKCFLWINSVNFKQQIYYLTHQPIQGGGTIKNHFPFCDNKLEQLKERFQMLANKSPRSVHSMARCPGKRMATGAESNNTSNKA